MHAWKNLLSSKNRSKGLMIDWQGDFWGDSLSFNPHIFPKISVRPEKAIEKSKGKGMWIIHSYLSYRSLVAPQWKTKENPGATKISGKETQKRFFSLRYLSLLGIFFLLVSSFVFCFISFSRRFQERKGRYLKGKIHSYPSCIFYFPLNFL